MSAKEVPLYVIYSRKSKFTGRGESVENQVEMCRQYISARYGQAAADKAHVYEDEGFSGKNLQRPQFRRMMQDARTMGFVAVVVYRLDRISRDIGDFANLIEELKERGIDFISIREQFDTATPMGRAMMYIASVFAQLERETIAERIRDNMHELAKTGRWLGGVTPTGYTSEEVSTVSVDGKQRRAFKLKSVPEELCLVRMIFEKFIETGSLTRVDQYLLEKRVMTKRGKRFTRFSLKGILSNPVYMIADEAAYRYMCEGGVSLSADKEEFDGKHGMMVYNRTLQRQGKTHKINPMDEWVVAVGRHKGLIPGEMWVAVQEKLELNRSKSYRKPRSNVALLSGLLYCDCGDYMRPKLTGRTTAAGEPQYNYLCTTKERSRSKCCAMRNASGNILDDKVIAVIKELGHDSEAFVRQVLGTKKQIGIAKESSEAEMSGVKQQLEENVKEIRRLLEALSRAEGTAAEKYVLVQIDELDRAGEALRGRLEELQAGMAQREMSETEFEMMGQMLSNFAECIDSYSVEQKRAAIRAVVERIVWNGENAHLYLLGAGGGQKTKAAPG